MDEQRENDPILERCFHCTSNGAYKFWQVSVAETVQTVRYGRIGTTGQVATKTFDSSDTAHTATERLIAQKLAKGYVAVTSQEAALALPKRPAFSEHQLLLSFDVEEPHREPLELSLF